MECAERGLDPMKTNLVVADPERTDRTICLAVSPSMKKLGVRNRCRVFEIPPNIDYIMAEPRMQKYIDYAAEIYGIYLRYISKEDIHVYSIDEAFLDVTPYLHVYEKTPKEMAEFLMNRVQAELGIRAACGIGTNLYLTKIALNILAKHSPDFIAFLDEKLYREKLWDYQPLTDFWRIGKGTARKLASMGIFTMRELSGAAEKNEELFYRKFGVDAELLIDHARGIEPVTISDIRKYRPKSRSLSNGQVLMRDYTLEEADIVVKEMANELCLRMTEEHLRAASVSIYVGYSNRLHRKGSGGTEKLPHASSASGTVISEMVKLFQKVTDHALPIRRIMMSVNGLEDEKNGRQLSLFGRTEASKEEAKERKIQEAVLAVKKRYGKNALLKGLDFEEAATQQVRNREIGGHKRGVDDEWQKNV